MPSELGFVAGKEATEKILQLSQPDWTGREEDQPSSLEKAGILGLKVLTTVGATAAIILLPHICIPVAAAHQVVCGSTAVGFAIKGAISGSSSGINAYLTQKIHGNYTPDPAKRQEYTNSVKDIKNGLSICGRVALGSHVPEIKGAAELVESAAVFAYDMQPKEVNSLLDRMQNIFS